jgi:FkbM family methyltransferase
MIRRLLHAVVRALPPGVLRAVGASQWKNPVAGFLVRHGSRWLRHGDAVIAHGTGAGLRFNPGGANPGYALGTSEPLVQKTLARLLTPGTVLYDVGANVGFFTILGARLVGPTGRVIAFEPLPDNVAVLRHNVALNAFDNVTVFECAVARASGTAELRLAAEPTWAKLSAEGAAAAPGDSLRVRVVTIDELIDAGTIPPPALLKIDVEGAELDVLAGMSRALALHRPVMLCEMHGTNRAFGALMRGLDYDIEVLEGAGRVELAAWNVHALARPR